MAARLVGRIEETAFSGVVRVDVGDETLFESASGRADRRSDLPNTPGTRFGIASGTKGITAATVLSLVDDGLLRLDQTARSVLGHDLPLVDDRVTIEHLLAHRSGIGDYLDESALEDVTDHVLAVPVHLLDEAEAYLAVLDGHPQVSEPGARFAYSNGGYAVLAIIAERAGGAPFRQLVADRVSTPAGMTSTGFPRSDELPADAAIGYLHDGSDRTNVLHLPVRGSGDGGLYATLGDVHRFWHALAAGLIVSSPMRDRMTALVSVTGRSAYGLGVWLSATAPWWQLEGSDAGVSFMTRHDRWSAVTWTVISNTSAGAWPIARILADPT